MPLAATKPGTSIPRGSRLAVIAIAAVALDGVLTVLDVLWLGPRLGQPDRSVLNQTVEVASIRLAAIGLALLASSPALVALALAGRRTAVAAAALGVGSTFGALVFLLEAGRLHGGVTDAAGLARIAWFDGPLVIAGPLLEESEKLVAIWAAMLVCGGRFGARAGLLLGAAVGIGANLAEIGLYAGSEHAVGTPRAVESVIAARIGVSGFGLHVATAALLGAGIALRRDLRLAAGLVGAAVLTHVAWNAFGPGLLDGLARVAWSWMPWPAAGGAPPLLLWLLATSISVLLAGPAYLIAAWTWRRGKDAGSPHHFEATEGAAGTS